jgi:hypothetical protein
VPRPSWSLLSGRRHSPGSGLRPGRSRPPRTRRNPLRVRATGSGIFSAAVPVEFCVGKLLDPALDPTPDSRPACRSPFPVSQAIRNKSRIARLAYPA